MVHPFDPILNMFKVDTFYFELEVWLLQNSADDIQESVLFSYKSYAVIS